MESILLIPNHTEAQGMLWGCICPTCQGTGISSVPVPSPFWGRGGVWYLETSLGSLWGCISGFLYSWFPHSRWDELGKDAEIFLRNPLLSKPSFLLIFLSSSSSPSKLYLVSEVASTYLPNCPCLESFGVWASHTQNGCSAVTTLLLGNWSSIT